MNWQKAHFFIKNFTNGHQIEQVKGETLVWNIDELSISQKAWNKVIHRGIKPVVIFAHPDILQNIWYAVSYYRMLAMVSQKSMNQVGLSSKRYEDGNTPEPKAANAIAQHLNKIISILIESDEEIDAREFDIWRGMAAGSQAQGSWQNNKGDKIESVIRNIILHRLREKHLIVSENDFSLSLNDDRIITFSDEPDIGFYQDGKIVTAIEIKGGIDKAAVLERIGATIKSLIRAKEENPDAITILILQSVSMTAQSINDLQINQNAINYWFTMEEVLKDKQNREALFQLLHI
ncbi:MAG: hypothetical protein DRR19_33640 [Candidatus Parabeggiatoa sp. nov. 1]|nr:MAG: hypothetical protein DRR19_33640 [Gammaproteobacteria bacterium]